VIAHGSPIHFLQVYDTLVSDIDWNHFRGPDLRSLSKVSLVGLNDAAQDLLDLVMKSECKELTLHSTMNSIPPTSAFVSHEVMQRVVDLYLEFGKRVFFASSYCY
jgi:hypothetical protein